MTQSTKTPAEWAGEFRQTIPSAADRGPHWSLEDNRKLAIRFLEAHPDCGMGVNALLHEFVKSS